MKRFGCMLGLLSLFIPATMNVDAKEIELKQIVDGTFNAKGMGSITPTADGIHYLTANDDYSRILMRSFKDKNYEEVVLDLATVRGNNGIKSFDDYILSPKEDKILIKTNSTKIFRRSSTADYYIFTIKNNMLEPLSNGGPQQEPKFSPDGNVIGFVREGNIFLVKLLFNNSESQITKDGKKNSISNGVPDWAYEEEFSFTSAFDFSADSKMVAYIKFNENGVNRFDMPFFQTVMEDANEQSLLAEKQVQYPVAGASYSKVSVHTFDIKSSVTRDIELELDSNTYIPRIKFVADEENNLFVFTLNRRQNNLEVYAANPRSTLCNLILRETDDRYIETTSYMDTEFYGDKFIMQSEKDGYNHLYLYNLRGKLERQITKGEWDVLAFHGYDAKSGTVYYESNEQDTYNRNVYKIDSKGRKTCLTPEEGFNTAIFSSNNSYFVNTWSDLNTPPVLSVYDNKGKQISVIEENGELKELVKEYDIVKKEFFSFTTSEGVELYGWMVKPANADESNKCPLILYQYGGPGSNEVMNSWNTGFYNGGTLETYLVNKGYAVAVVDGRGTGMRGADFKKQTYLQLGVMESRDQVEAAKYLSALPFIDADRIGIWGWSYGGYNTLMSMSEGTPVFKAGVAVAPVTDWRFYDAPYTERFMQMPKENGEGYKASSAIERIDKLNGRLLLVHGLDDDNVFFSNTTAYMQALIEKGIQFDMQVYPGKEHSLVGRSTRMHLFGKIVEFFDRELK
ncbi:MAG: S9 family peptidase [Bacteroidaceae bacterium]|nr:S9 family peptidase [Bacteroidaceae bacterium]